MEPVAVIDFETTGLSPSQGARATEVAAVIVQDGKVVSRYQSLMNAGVRVPAFITDLTGITNAMVQGAPSARQVMRELCEFLGPLPLIAHNASFDKKFFEYECQLAGISHETQFACSMLVSRRLFPGSPNHKLGTLVNHLRIRRTGQFHRALSDAEMAARLVLAIHKKISDDCCGVHISHAMLRTLQRTKYADVQRTLAKFGEEPSPYRKPLTSITPPNTFIRSELAKETPTKTQPDKPLPQTAYVTASAERRKPGSSIFWLLAAAALLLVVFAN